MRIYRYPTPRTTSLCGGSGSWKLIQGNDNLTADEKRAMSSTRSSRLNPDWVEWLMGWPVWWTDVEFKNVDGGQCAMPWLDPSDDPADWNAPLMGRLTDRREYAAHRIQTLGNGQVPLCAAVAFAYGRELLNNLHTKDEGVEQ